MLEWLNANSGGVSALATIALVIITVGYVCLVRTQTAEIRKQSKEVVRRERTQVKRALETIVAELSLNDAAVVRNKPSGHRPPFLTATHSRWDWACLRERMSAETRTAVGDAYLTADRFNAVQTQTLDAGYDKLWEAACKSLKHALETLAQDGTLPPYLKKALGDWPGATSTCSGTSR